VTLSSEKIEPGKIPPAQSSAKKNSFCSEFSQEEFLLFILKPEKIPSLTLDVPKA
jgi:hypothetical protein